MIPGKSIWRGPAGMLAFALTLAGLVGPVSGWGGPNASSETRPAEKSVQKESVIPVAGASTWSMQSNCAGCHTTEAASQTDGMHSASRHAEIPCVTCHQDDSTLSVAHTDLAKTPSQTWLDAPIDNAVCFKCHEGWASLAKRTQNSRALVDLKNAVVNPHAIPQTASHNQNPFCHVCHAMHLGAKPVGEYCVGCHHKKVFECYSCHKSNDFPRH